MKKQVKLFKKADWSSPCIYQLAFCLGRLWGQTEGRHLYSGALRASRKLEFAFSCSEDKLKSAICIQLFRAQTQKCHLHSTVLSANSSVPFAFSCSVRKLKQLFNKFIPKPQSWRPLGEGPGLNPIDPLPKILLAWTYLLFSLNFRLRRY